MTRVGPLAAFLVVVAVDLFAFAVEGVELVAGLGLAVGLAATAGTMRPFRRVLLTAPSLVLVTVLLYGLMMRGDAVASWGPLGLSALGLRTGLAISARLVVLLLAALWAIEVVAGRDVLDLAARLRFVTLGLTARASSTLAADARRIREAQTMRGLGARGLSTYRAYLVPLFVVSLRRAQTSSRALALAGLGERRRTHLRAFPWYPADLAWSAGSLALMVAALVLLGGAR